MVGRKTTIKKKVVNLCSKLVMGLSYDLHIAYGIKFKTLAGIEPGTSPS